MCTSKKIMILGAGILQIPAIKKAKELGLYTVVLDIDTAAPGFNYADECVQISTIDASKALEVAKEYNVKGVITLASDMPIRTVATIGEELGLNTISLKTAINATDKGKMRAQLRFNNVPIPEFKIVSSLKEFKEEAMKFKNRFIAKPTDNSGSRGVTLVESYVELTSIYKYVKQNSRSGEIILEEYLSGPEVSVETFSVNGQTRVISITDKLTTGSPHFIEMGHSIPSSLPTNIQEDIINVAVSAVKAIGINNGPSHTEIIVTPEGPKVVEIGARLGGDNITTHLVPLSTGVDMVEAIIRLSIGEEVDIQQKYNKASSIRYINTPEGKIESITGVKNAMSIEGVKAIIISKNIGEEVKKLKNSNDRFGYVISQADTTIEAINICEEVLSKINIGISKLD